MHVVWVEFSIKEEHLEAFIGRVQQQASDSLSIEPGCHTFDVCIGGDNSNIVALYETYSDAEAFQTHLRSPHFVAFNSTVTDWVLEKRVLELQRL